MVNGVIAQDLFCPVEITDDVTEPGLQAVVFLFQIFDPVIQPISDALKVPVLGPKGTVFGAETLYLVLQLYIGIEDGAQDTDDLLPDGLDAFPVGFCGLHPFRRGQYLLRVGGEVPG